MRKILLPVAIIIAMAGCSKEADSDSWADPVVPVSLLGIEAVNIDNSGEQPQVSASPVKKEAYMLGIKWITGYELSDDDDMFITGPVRKGENQYGSLASRYSKAIKCNDRFSAAVAAGKYVSKFFKEADSDYLPADIDEGFVLLVAPDPGQHSFRVEYYDGQTLMFFHDTPPVNFY
ncbi:MAG: hypothetical protein LBV41_10925 [Cytophagaceae bacterium]|nr:hypothetical protein [Cytophagaceae bacterium]